MTMTPLSDHLFHPFVHAGVLACLGGWLCRRHRLVSGLLLCTCAVAWLLVSATPAFAAVLWAGLAAPYPQGDSRGYPTTDAIVVLGGGRLPMGHGPWDAGDDASTRLAFALQLWADKRAPLLVTVGSDQALPMLARLRAQGVPRTQLLAEDASRDTHENAGNAAALLRGHGIGHILLVTSDIHMARAVGAFTRAGIRATPAPAHEPRPLDHAAWMPRRDAVTMTARCLREYVALWVYRWRGWA